MEIEELPINIDIPPITSIEFSGVEEKDMESTLRLLERILQNALEDATRKFHAYLNAQQEETAAAPLVRAGGGNSQTIRLPGIGEIESGMTISLDKNHFPEIKPQNNSVSLPSIPSAPEKAEEESGVNWLDIAEMIPVVGSIIGAVREGMKGNWGMMALNIGFLALDVAGLFTGGAATAASMAAKAALKGGIKIATKTIIKKVLQAGVQLLKKAAQNALKAGGQLARAVGRKVWNAGAKAVKKTVQTVTSGVKAVKKTVGKVWNAGIEFVKAPIQTVKSGVKETVGKAWRGFKSIFGKNGKKQAQTEILAPKAKGKIFETGPYNSLKNTEVGLDAHHVGQKALMSKFVPGYNPSTAPSILVPKLGHTKGAGVLSRGMSGFSNARQVLARDIFELRRVYPNIPNNSLKQLIQMNKSMYPGAFIK